MTRGGRKADSKSVDARLKTRGRKGGKKEKDPNIPKRPPSAFFVFLEEFMKQFIEANLGNKSVAAVAKAAGDKWKSMSVAAGGANVAEGDDSDESKSEVNDEEERGGGEEDEE